MSKTIRDFQPCRGQSTSTGQSRATRMRKTTRAHQQRNKLDHVLKSACNFSLGCHEDTMLQPPVQDPKKATDMIGRQQSDENDDAGVYLVKGSRLLLDIQATDASSPPHLNATSLLYNYPGNKQPILLEHNSASLYFKHSDAATAMVGMVRLILVVLICVLLVKLHAIPGVSSVAKRSTNGNKSGQHGNRRRRTSSSSSSSSSSSPSLRRKAVTRNGEELQNSSDRREGEREQEDRHNESHRATSKISSFKQQQGSSRLMNQTNFKKIFQNFTSTTTLATNTILFNNPSVAQPQRRFSQPILPAAGISATRASTSTSNTNERRRRYSDTNVIMSALQLPPGPTGLPFLGYLPFLGSEIHLTLTELSQRFGPIYQIFLGGIRVVVLNDAALVRQAFKQTVFSGRPDTQLTRILQGYGIVNSDGALWKEQRAFLHSALRKLGAKSLMSGTNGLEAKIQNQVREFVNDLSLHADEGKPCQVRPIVARAVSSVVGSVVMNLTYRKYEEKFDRLIELMQEGFRLFSIAMPLDFIPIFRFLPGVSYAYKKMKRNRAETSAFFQTVADEHRRYLSETFNLNMPNTASSLHPKLVGQSQLNQQDTATDIPKTILTSDTITRTIKRQQSLLKQKAAASSSAQELEETSQASEASNSSQLNNGGKNKTIELEQIVARDLVDAYIVQQKKHENDGKENYFSDQQLVQIMSDIFSAGLETVTSTIEWSILFLILNPECQERIQSEIDEKVGRTRLPQLEDLAQMPYTEATIYEVLRRSNVVALGNAHATLADATIGGYRIPKGTQVLPNLYGIHMNPKLWNEPDRFDPQRFIVNERAQKPDYFIPFSVGRRMCLGDVLAKMEVFLFLVGLLQKYDLSVHEIDRNCPPEVKGTIGVSNAPVPFRVALKARNAHQHQQDLH